MLVIYVIDLFRIKKIDDKKKQDNYVKYRIRPPSRMPTKFDHTRRGGRRPGGKCSGGKGHGRGRGRGHGGDSTGTVKNFVWVRCPIGYFALMGTFKDGFPRVRKVGDTYVFALSDLLDAAVTKKERMMLANLLNKQSGVKYRLIDPKTGLGVKVNVWNSVQAKNFTPFVYRLSSLEYVCKICRIDLPPMWSREDQSASIIKLALLRHVKHKKFAATAAASKAAAAAAAAATATTVAATAAAVVTEAAAAAISAAEGARMNAARYLAMEARARAACDAAVEEEEAAAVTRTREDFGEISSIPWGDSSDDEI